MNKQDEMDLHWMRHALALAERARNEHDEIPAQVFKRASIGSAANCIACHSGAEQGYFDEDSVRIPR